MCHCSHTLVSANSLYQPLVLPWRGQSRGSPCQSCWGRPGQRRSVRAPGPPRQSRAPPLPSDAQKQLWAFPESPRLLVRRDRNIIFIDKCTHIHTGKMFLQQQTHTFCTPDAKWKQRKHWLTYKHHGGLNAVRFIPLKEHRMSRPSEQTSDCPRPIFLKWSLPW